MDTKDLEAMAKYWTHVWILIYGGSVPNEGMISKKKEKKNYVRLIG